jgi:hypothetical protein
MTSFTDGGVFTVLGINAAVALVLIMVFGHFRTKYPAVYPHLPPTTHIMKRTEKKSGILLPNSIFHFAQLFPATTTTTSSSTSTSLSPFPYQGISRDGRRGARASLPGCVKCFG